MLELTVKGATVKGTSTGVSSRERHHGSNQPRIALIQPDSPHLYVPNSFPGLGLMYISSHLKTHGYESDFFDFTGKKNNAYANGDGLSGSGNGRSIDGYQIYGVSAQITQFREATEMMRDLRANNPDAIFVVGGPFVSRSPEYGVREGWDVTGQGEGEDIMVQVANRYPNIRRGETLAAVEFADVNVLPDWSAIDVNDYVYQLEGKKCANIMTKRGNCPYHCTFCALQEVGVSKLRNRSIENVLGEAKFLRDELGFGSLAVYDDEVLLDKKRDEEIFRGFQKLGMPYRAMTRANLADKGYIEMLAETGCKEMCIGIETGDPFIHEVVVEKGTTVQQHTDFVQNAKEAGLRVKTFVILGLPSESRQTIANTRKWLEDNRPENFDTSLFTPYPGAPIFGWKDHFEIDWDQKNLEEIWFTGKAQYDDCAVWTPYLTSAQIGEQKEELQDALGRGWGGSRDYWGPIVTDEGALRADQGLEQRVVDCPK